MGVKTQELGIEHNNRGDHTPCTKGESVKTREPAGEEYITKYATVA